MIFQKITGSIDAVKAFQFANMLRQGSMFLTGVILAKSGFSNHDIGSYEYIYFFIATASFFWLNGLIQHYAANHARENREEFEKNITQILIGLTILFSIIITILHISKLIHFAPGWYMLFMILFFFYVPSMFIDNVLLVRNDSFTQMIVSLFFFFIHLAGLLIMVLISKDITHVLYLFIIISAIKFIILLYLTKAYKVNKSVPGNSQRILMASLPFIGYFLVTGTAGIIDGWIIKLRFNDPAFFAMYRYGARDLPVIGTLAIGLSAAVLPKFAISLTDGILEIKNRSAKLMHFVYPTVIFVVAFSKDLFPLLFNRNFTETAFIFSIFSFITGARFLFPHTILIGLGESRFLFFNSIAELCINIGFSLLLSYYFGLSGIAMGTVIAYFYEKIAAAYYLYQIKGIKLSEYTPLGFYVLYNSLLVLIFVISQLN